MEPQQIATQTTPTVKNNLLFRVTPFSKYSAMMLFVLMPFVGGWIGYRYASDKVVAVLEASPEAVLTENAQNPETSLAVEVEHIFYAEHVKLFTNAALYTALKDEIMSFYSDQITSGGGINRHYLETQPYIDVVKIGDDTLFVHTSFTTDDDLVHEYDLLVTVNVEANEATIVRELEIIGYQMMPETWIQTALNHYSLVRLETTSGYHPNEVVLYDFVANKKEILYSELDSNISLAPSCELGCIGPLFATNSELLFCRYEKIPQSIESKFVECKELEY